MVRQTTRRAAIEQVLSQAEGPMRVEDILKEGRGQVPSLNLATVYRNLKAMVEKGQLLKLNHPALGALYELSGRGHHHNFYCRSCDRLFSLPGCPLKEELPAPPGFVTEGHEVFLFGTCPDCGKRF